MLPAIAFDFDDPAQVHRAAARAAAVFLELSRPWPPRANPLEQCGPGAEEPFRSSVSVRAAYAFGDWPPACNDPACPSPDRHVRHIGDDDAAEAAPAVQEPAA